MNAPGSGVNRPDQTRLVMPRGISSDPFGGEMGRHVTKAGLLSEEFSRQGTDKDARLAGGSDEPIGHWVYVSATTTNQAVAPTTMRSQTQRSIESSYLLGGPAQVASRADGCALPHVVHGPVHTTVLFFLAVQLRCQLEVTAPFHCFRFKIQVAHLGLRHAVVSFDPLMAGRKASMLKPSWQSVSNCNK